jgi:hypothetical protein
MEKELIFALISTLFVVIGIFPLWRDILKWRTTPHPFTTWIWLILVWINIVILFTNKEYYWLIPSILVFITLLWETIYWFIRINKIILNWFDWICMILSILALTYFLITRNWINTVIMTIIIDLIAALPTVKKSWLQPWTETAWNYFIWWSAMVFTILALSAPNLETSLYWLSILFIDLTIVFILVFRRYYLKGYNSIFD